MNPGEVTTVIMKFDLHIFFYEGCVFLLFG